jgi:superfamily I DNA/RNA helicase
MADLFSTADRPVFEEYRLSSFQFAPHIIFIHCQLRLALLQDLEPDWYKLIVQLVSMHSSKGLEFPLVIIPHLGMMPKPGEDEAHEARLLYVAMTRATERLLLIHHEDSVFSARIRASINDVTAQLAGA